MDLNVLIVTWISMYLYLRGSQCITSYVDLNVLLVTWISMYI